MKKRLFQILLLAMIFGLMLFSSSTGVYGFEFSSAAEETTTSDPGWILLVDGSVQQSLSLTLDEVAAMPRSTEYAELYCVGKLVDIGYWTGVRLGLVLEMAGFDQQAGTVEFHAQDGYATSLPIGEAMRGDVIIAYEKDDQPLPETLRLVVPGMNGNIWISMITQITVSMSITEFPSPTMQPLPTPRQSPTPQPPPTSKPNNQSTTQPIVPPSSNQTITAPVVPPPDGQPEEEKYQSSSTLPMEYSYLVIVAIVVALGAVGGYSFSKRKKSSVLTETRNE